MPIKYKDCPRCEGTGEIEDDCGECPPICCPECEGVGQIEVSDT